MISQTKKIVLFVLGGIGLVVLSSFATIGAISLHSNKQAEPSPVAEVAPPPAPIAEVTPPPAPIDPPAPVVPPAPPMAQVLSVKPHYVTTSKPVKSCYQEPQTIYPQQNNNPPIAGAVIGGVTGGFAGSAIRGKNHTAAIVAGAALGAVTGGAVQKNMNQPKPQTIYVTQCHTKTVSSKVQKGYDVTYLYNGMQSTTVMSTPPASNMIPPPYPVSN